MQQPEQVDEQEAETNIPMSLAEQVAVLGSFLDFIYLYIFSFHFN